MNNTFRKQAGPTYNKTPFEGFYCSISTTEEALPSPIGYN